MKPNECCAARKKGLELASKRWLSSLICFLLMLSTQRYRASAQSTEVQKEQQQIKNILSDPAVLTRVYGRFFAYQNHLDNVAGQLEAAGKDASGLRSSLQKRLGFSDDEYKPIRTSCNRVASEIKVLDEEVKLNHQKSTSYSAVRDQQVNAEITTLTSELSAEKKAAFEALIVQWFVPKQDPQKAVQQ